MTGPIAALAYLGVSTDRVTDWRQFATSQIGMQVVDRSGKTTALRMDSRHQRLLVADDGHSGFCGWEVADAASLDELADRLDAADTPYRPLGVRCQERFVTDGLTFTDPAGNQVEVVLAPHSAGEPFVPGRNHSGFRTGALGMGHLLMTVPDVGSAVRFYVDVLGFALSDYTLEPFKAFFLHCNARHHSLAFIEGPNTGIHHLMVEMNSFDDVGQGYDIALGHESQIGVTLGRHSNDHMFSFYTRTPSPFMIETGWGGRSIDPQTWEPCELVDGPSIWGHDRRWLPEDKQRQAYDMRVLAAQKGVRHPVHVQPGNHDMTQDPVKEHA